MCKNGLFTILWPADQSSAGIGVADIADMQNLWTFHNRSRRDPARILRLCCLRACAWKFSRGLRDCFCNRAAAGSIDSLWVRGKLGTFEDNSTTFKCNSRRKSRLAQRNLHKALAESEVHPCAEHSRKDACAETLGGHGKVKVSQLVRWFCWGVQNLR